LSLSFVVGVITCSAIATQPTPPANRSERGDDIVTRPSDPASWDVFFLFLLRVLHGLFGGDTSDIPDGMDTLAAMQVVSTHYSAQGVPPATLLGKLQARAMILQCRTYILTSPHANESPYQAFLEVLTKMDSDVN
jgi:hypothetical protein